MFSLQKYLTTGVFSANIVKLSVVSLSSCSMGLVFFPLCIYICIYACYLNTSIMLLLPLLLEGHSIHYRKLAALYNLCQKAYNYYQVLGFFLISFRPYKELQLCVCLWKLCSNLSKLLFRENDFSLLQEQKGKVV